MILGPLLCNITYNGLLRLVLTRKIKIIAFTDYDEVVIADEYLEEIINIFNESFAIIQYRMLTVGMELAAHKTEAVLIKQNKHTDIKQAQR